MTTPTPRWYVCDQDGCIHRNVPRPVMPTPVGDGLLVWPSVSCICSPDVECPILQQGLACRLCGETDPPGYRFHVCPPAPIESEETR